MLFLRQVFVLVYKNILIAFIRRPITTLLRALALPIFIAWFFSYARNFFAAPSVYGVGTPQDVRTLADALPLTGTRNQLVFVNNGFQGGQIEQVITEVGDIARNAGKTVRVIENDQDLLTVCRNSLRGASSCIAGVVFHSSPTEPEGQNLPFNYTLRFDGVFGSTVFVDRNTNGEQVFMLPLQKAIDRAIAGASGLDVNAVETLQEFPFTAATNEQHQNTVRLRYLRAIVNFLGVAFFIGMCGIQYQQVGAQATEREIKMSQLLEVMMPNKRRWEPQVARLLSYHISFSLLYLPGWIIMAVILKTNVFTRTSMGLVMGLHILTGLSLASFSLFAAAFFKRAQLSGISTILLSLVLAIIAQVTPLSDAAVYVLSFLFPSMNYVFNINFMGRFEQRDVATILTQSAPNATRFSVTGLIFWIFLGVQILMYPILAIIVERCLWGTASNKRHLSKRASGSAVRLQNFSKHFRPSWATRLFSPCVSKNKKKTVRAVDDLSFSVRQGQIVVLLGANGSGKSTTLDAIAGLSKPTSGDITVNFDHGIGFCPQQNVLWKDVTVYEHIRIFDQLKSQGKRANKQKRLNLIRDCDLDSKTYAKAGSLSGGQMRKLQLASMFIGNSGICLVDECSSGIDPLARKKVQDILLAERSRSRRTIIFTSHYLDEADIADYILIMSKGKLKVQGTAPEIKHSGQYRIHIYHQPGHSQLPYFENVSRREMYDQTVYTVNDATSASRLLTEIEAQGFHDYSVNGPTVEDAFMTVAEEMVPSNDKVVELSESFDPSNKEYGGRSGNSKYIAEFDTSNDPPKPLDLHSGTHIGPFRQASVLFWKRCRVFFRSVYPNLAALIIVPLAAGLTSRFLESFRGAGCIAQENVISDTPITLATALAAGSSQGNLPRVVLGPRNAWNAQAINLVLASLPANIRAAFGGAVGSTLSNVPYVRSQAGLVRYINNNFAVVRPGGVFLGTNDQPPTIAYLRQEPEYIAFPVLLQNLVSTIRYQTPIALAYQTFDIPWQAQQGDTLQYTIYFGLVLAAAPAFFALYPTMERIRHVRGLHYSNGVRALPLWLSYTLFDLLFVLVAATVSIAILDARFRDVMFGLGHFWFVMVLFGLCATLCSYVISLFARSQLAAFAIAAAFQAVSSLLWLIAYLSLVTYGDTNNIDRNLNLAHFCISLIMPAGSLFKALFVSLNVFSINCRGSGDYIGSPGDITAYGGPIMYLIIQSVLLFTLLVWWDSGGKFSTLFRHKNRVPDYEEKRAPEAEVLEEIRRVQQSDTDGLKVLHLSKAYGKNLAVDDASFGVKRGEVFGLLGPNGAGKSTTISILRGDLQPHSSTSISIENNALFPSNRRTRNIARQHLSACPQHDATDRLTVTEHLRFYARIRGIPNAQITHNVNTVLRAVGLTPFASRLAEKLSGGNKRKLSLAIALMGNPSVMLLDEPSSGMDVAAKRIMWRTLESVVGGRSIVLTTHSMEEADRLCNRAGILARRMLTIGSIDDLKRRHGGRYYVHLLLKSAPYTDYEEEERVKRWIERTFEGARVDTLSHHGQIRFEVPINFDSSSSTTQHVKEVGPTSTISPTRSRDSDGIYQISRRNTNPYTSNSSITRKPIAGSVSGSGGTRIASLFATLEANKHNLGFEYYSVGHATLDQVFLHIVTKHNVEEENSRPYGRRQRMGWKERIRSLM